VIYLEFKVNDFITAAHKVVKNGNSHTVAVPKEWGAIGEVVIVVVKDDNTIILKKNIEIKDMDVRVSQDPHE